MITETARGTPKVEAKILNFTRSFRAGAEQVQADSGCLFTINLAQWALETGWGQASSLMERNNLSGIKNTHFNAHPGVYATFGSLEEFYQTDAALMKSDCPGLANPAVALADQTPLTVFTGSDWSTNPGYAQEVDAVWRYDILPAIAELDAEARLNAPTEADEPTEPSNETPDTEPASATPESSEPSEPTNETPDTEPTPAPAPTGTKVLTLPAIPVALRNDAWEVQVTLEGPAGQQWTGAAQLDTGAFETVVPGVPNGLASVLGLPDLGSLTIAGVTGSEVSQNSEVTITFTDPVTRQSLQIPKSPCVIDPTYDGLLIGAKVFIDRKISVLFNPDTQSVSFYV